ncbi:hypothetical protein SDC9_09083 [bioreactor metagenome]|uniref:Uncharacterized protein n=1 Tax=bioreactor metagenome TaxID=1076179 RepID=A0A644T936_9ZZZZ|nr:hypothetical protein [Negativicutes bacterium]
MSNNSTRFTVTLAAIILTLALLGGGQFLWQQYAIDKPLAEVLNSIDGIDSFYLDNSNKINDTVKVHISLSNVKNLQKTYQAVHDGAIKVLGHNQISIFIHDNRTPELEQLYYTVHLYVQEGISTGNFAAMAERIQQKTSASGVETQVYVDASNVYLSFKSINADMYVVVPRQQTEVK